MIWKSTEASCCSSCTETTRWTCSLTPAFRSGFAFIWSIFIFTFVNQTFWINLFYWNCYWNDCWNCNWNHLSLLIHVVNIEVVNIILYLLNSINRFLKQSTQLGSSIVINVNRWSDISSIKSIESVLYISSAVWSSTVVIVVFKVLVKLIKLCIYSFKVVCILL